MLRINKPSTVLFTVADNCDTLKLFDNKNRIYFYRLLPENTKEVKINIPDKGNYFFNCDGYAKIKPLHIHPAINSIRLPERERYRDKDFFIIHDDKETRSPAVIYTGEGLIVTGKQFKNLSVPMRIFILLHEVGHFRYKTEEYCDLFALVMFCKMGYNPSTAIYCLTDVLRKNLVNEKRVMHLFNILKKHEIVK